MFKLGKDVKIHPTAEIRVDNGFIGDRSVVRANAIIEGRDVRIGREAMICEYAVIGGGSRYESTSSLVVGDFLHMGRYSMINQGFGIKVGHEFGCGVESKVYTHGAYLSEWEGFPSSHGTVKIGDRVWMPYAQVNPGVKIGNDIVVMAMSIVNSDLPSGSMAGGIPCKILQENAYPRILTAKEKGDLFRKIFNEAARIHADRRGKKGSAPNYKRVDEDVFSLPKSSFDIKRRRIEGTATQFSEVLKDQLRRHGIRFRFKVEDDQYVPW